MKTFSRFLITVALLYPSAATAQEQPVTVIVVRHAEKAAEPKDNPPLTSEGAMRAAKLAEVLQHAGVTTIYSTPYARTLETAQPLAKALNLTVTETPIPNRSVGAYASDIAARVKRDSGVVVVVGHSNTIGPVIKALGGADIGEIPDERYDDLFVLTIQDGKPTRLVKSKYGARWESVTK
jgi:broad specificity phosphatase PhoE